MTTSPLKIETLHDGRLVKLTLARPKANIVDAEMLGALQVALDEHRDNQCLAAVLLNAEGPNFSFGASVEEHLPGQCTEMLQIIDGLILSMIGYPVPIVVAVRGYCLGGGLEVACGGHLMFASPDANFAQPEIQLAVFAPAASCLLPERIGRIHAEDLLFSGRSINAEEALRVGLINAVADDPEQAALEYIEKQLLSKSSFALRHAVWAARIDFVDRMRDKFSKVEKRYIAELMSGNDPVAGLKAFIEKRRVDWEHC